MLAGRTPVRDTGHAMNPADFDKIHIPPRGAHPAATHAWREWCFFKAAMRRFRVRFALILTILLAGALAFQVLEPEKQHSLPRAMYYTWSLVFGEPPEEFPRAPLLQVLFFIVPVLGLIVILESIVDFALMLRDRRANERSWCREMSMSLSNHVILVGLGKLGIRNFRLLRKLGEAVAVIERKPDNQFLEEIRRDGAPLFIGDARREALLEDANAAQAKSIILATNDDLANLEVALDARRLNPNIRCVLRLFDQNMADKIRSGFGIQIAMSQSAISAPAFVMSAVESSIVGSTVINDQLIVMKRWKVRHDGPLCNKSVARVTRDWKVSVVECRKPGMPPMLFPLPNTRLEDGDELLVQGMFEVLSRLEDRGAGVPTTLSAD